MTRSVWRAIVTAVAIVLFTPGWAAAAPGDLDTSFSGDGIASSQDFPGVTRGGTDMVVAPDGSVLVAGERSRADVSNFAVFKLTPAGVPDTTFSNDGVAVADFGLREETEELALMNDGRIVVVGTQIDASNQPPTRRLAVAVFTPKGKLDPSFSGDGRLLRGGTTNTWGYGVAVDASNRIVIVGGRNNSYTVFRYLPTGAVDTTFGVGGATNVPGMSANTFSNFPEPVDVAVQPDSRILALGVQSPTGDSDCALARLTAAGQMDSSFSGDGFVAAGLNSPNAACSGIALAGTGKVTIAGSTGPGQTVLARFTSSGGLDPNLDGDGRVIASLGEAESRAVGVTLEGTKTIAVGLAVVGGMQVWMTARFTAMGQLDPTFSGDGLAFRDFSPSSDTATVPILDGGRVLVAGSLGAASSWAVAAYIAGV